MPNLPNAEDKGNPPVGHAPDPPPDGTDVRPLLRSLRAELREDVRDAVRRENEALLERHAAQKPLLSIEDVAETLGKSKRWCETALANGDLPAPLWIGGTRRWHPDSVEAYLRAQAAATSAGRAGR